jgi:hypothetical protein
MKIWILLTLLTFPTILQAQFITFVTNTVPAGYGSDFVAAADVNGDRKIDLVSVNYGSNSLTILTNNGNGNFGSNATVAVGGGPVFAVLADVNGDGSPDLVCANELTNTLTVLTNNGCGVFGSNATLKVGFGPGSVVVMDVNGDGKPDLVSANEGVSPNYTNTLTVLTNNEAGVFGFNATLTSGVYGVSFPHYVTTADVNGDGKPDLIVANYFIASGSAGTLTVLTNNGVGGFGSNATLNVGNGPWSVIAADINSDGKTDLISVNHASSTLTVLTNNGAGSFGFNATLNVISYPYAVVAVDLRGSGNLDLVCVSDNRGLAGKTLTIFTNNGTGVFGLNETLVAGSIPTWIVSADVNNDGLPDLITANDGNNTLSILTQVIVGQPLLAIYSTGANSVLTWSSFSTGFVLQTNADLTTTNWSNVGATITVNNGTNQSATIISPTSGNLFFRLKE